MILSSIIVDELGHIVANCSDLYGDEIDEILESHPEYSIRCIQIG